MYRALPPCPGFSAFQGRFTWGLSTDPYVMPLVEVGRNHVDLLLKPLQFHDEGGVPRKTRCRGTCRGSGAAPSSE